MTWIDSLREQCSRHSQKWVGEKMGYSAAVVNQVLKGSYKGNLTEVEKAVKGAFMNETVDCPVMGEMAGHVCVEHQKQPFSSINPMRVKLFKACRGGCPHSRHSKEPS